MFFHISNLIQAHFQSGNHNRLNFQICFNFFFFIQIGQIEDNIYINILSSGQKMESFTARNKFQVVKARFLPGTSLFLPAGDVGGEIKSI